MVAITVEVPSILLDPTVLVIFSVFVASLLIVCGNKLYKAPKEDRKPDAISRNQDKTEKESSIPPKKANSVYRMEEDITITEESSVTRSGIWRKGASWYDDRTFLPVFLTMFSSKIF